MSEKLFAADLYYEQTGRLIVQTDPLPRFIRGDSIVLRGKAYGAAIANVLGATPTTNLTATLTGKMILPDGSTGPTVFSKTGSDVVIKPINIAVCSVEIVLDGIDTQGFEKGQRFVFDVEFKTLGTHQVTQTLKSSFFIEEDYTVAA